MHGRLGQLFLDARFGARQLRRAPLVTSVAIATLAIGIGLNTAVFSLVHAVLLRPLPYPEADRLVWITPYHVPSNQDTWGSRADYRQWRARTRLFDRLTAYGTQDLSLVAADVASQERVASFEGDFWSITGAVPAVGRLLSPDEETSMVISHGLFERRFGGQTSVIGRAVNVGGAMFTIVGVLPASYRMTFPQQTAPGDELRAIDAFIVLPRGEEAPGAPIRATTRPAPPWVRVAGRLAPGVPIERARPEMQAFHARLQQEFPRHEALRRGLRVLPLAEKLTEQVRLSLVVLQGAVAFVLLIAAVNVANLLLAQAARRTKETAIRAALGASRGRLLTQFLVESALLAAIAGVVGVAVAKAAVPLLARFAPFAVTGLADVAVDGPVLLFALGVAAATTVLFAWAPVFETSRAGLTDTLSGSASSLATSSRAQGVLIGLEAALALVLLTAAGLMVKSLWQLQSAPAGFTPRGAYTMRIPLSGPAYEDLGNKHAYVHNLLDRLTHASGVEAAGISAATYNMPVNVSGATAGAPDARPVVAVRMVSPDWLRAMGVSLVRGRWPDAANALDAVVVNETFARRVVPDGDPIGRAISGSFLSGTIVGISADFVASSLDGAAMPELYYPWQRAPGLPAITLAVRMPEAAAPMVRSLVEGLDRSQPVYRFQSLEASLAESIAPRRFNTFLLDIYALAAVLMALAGTFGVVARSVSRRTREAAVRIALGARPHAVVFLIVRQAMVWVLLGVGAGIVATLGAGRVLKGLLHGVEPHDPATLALVSAALIAAAFLACWLPASRAARIDPVAALREE
jgi:putative ABC transport system permease protein